MHASHAVAAQPDRDLIRITLSGFFGPGEVENFNAARLAAHRQLRCGPNQHVTLVDLREMKIQAQDLLPQFRAMIAEPRTRARRLAFVVGCSLVRAQVRWLIDRDDIACFDCPDEAEGWLTAPPARLALAG